MHSYAQRVDVHAGVGTHTEASYERGRFTDQWSVDRRSWSRDQGVPQRGDHSDEPWHPVPP